MIHNPRPEALTSSLMNFPSTTCYHCFVSNRSPPSSMSMSMSMSTSMSMSMLEALRLRVETRQRTRGRYRDQGAGGSLLPPGTCEAFGEGRRERTANGTIDSTYQSLMGWQEEVRASTRGKYRCSEARLATFATTRSTRAQYRRPPMVLPSCKWLRFV